MTKKTLLAVLLSAVLLTSACSVVIDTDSDTENTDALQVTQAEENVTDVEEILEEPVSQKYNGIIKEFEDGGYGSFSLYIESSNGTQTGLTSCDKTAGEAWEQVVSASNTGLNVDVYGSETQGGVCVNAITVNY